MKIISGLIIMVLPWVAAAADLPAGWFKTGSNATGYQAQVVDAEIASSPVATLKSNQRAELNGFGTVMQRFFPEAYLGQRVQMTFWAKTDIQQGWAGGWMRIDDDNKKTLSFDNMSNRAIKGKSDWQQYAIVLDVPKNAESLNYGFLLSGMGQVWFDEFDFKVVPDSVALTDTTERTALNKQPMNNSF